MKIIKAGTVPQDRILQGTCRNCNAEVEFTQGEATRHSHRNETHYTIPCPTPKCLHSISVEA